MSGNGNKQRVCAACQLPINAGDKFVEISHRSRSKNDGKLECMHETCYQMAINSPDIDLRAIAAIAEDHAAG